MSLELFNKTNRVKEVPKFRYNGKIRLYPGGTYPIEDYMASFFKPYERLGIIIRKSAMKEPIESEVESILNEPVYPEIHIGAVQKYEDSELLPNSDNKVTEIHTEDTNKAVESSDLKDVESTSTEEGEMDRDAVHDLSKEEATTVEDNKVYTKDELEAMQVSEVRKIVSDLNLKVEGDLRKKAPYIEAILNSQE